MAKHIAWLLSLVLLSAFQGAQTQANSSKKPVLRRSGMLELLVVGSLCAGRQPTLMQRFVFCVVGEVNETIWERNLVRDKGLRATQVLEVSEVLL
jgi:hypothetical protein